MKDHDLSYEKCRVEKIRIETNRCTEIWTCFGESKKNQDSLFLINMISSCSYFVVIFYIQQHLSSLSMVETRIESF